MTKIYEGHNVAILFKKFLVLCFAYAPTDGPVITDALINILQKLKIYLKCIFR